VKGIRRIPLLRAWGLSKFEEYRAGLDGLRPPLTTRQADRLSMIAVHAANSWAVLLRSYYLASMTGAVLADGSRATNSVSIGSVEDAITFAVHATRPRLASRSGPWTNRDEPDWTNGGAVAALLVGAGSSTAVGFAAAVSLGTASREELATYRNFVAHSNRDTALKVRNIGATHGVGRSGQPLEIPLQRELHRPQSIVADWLDDLWAMISMMPS
jgi:hypothetical protein